MKTKTWLLCISLLSTSLLSAQVGIKGGLNLSSVASSAQEVDQQQMALGWQAGLMARAEINKTLSIQPELYFVQKGSEYEYLGALVTQKLQYVELPLLLILEPFGALLNLQVGPQVSWLTGVETTYVNGPFGTSGTIHTNKEDYNQLDYGISVGAGITLNQLSIDVRLVQGFQNIEKDAVIGPVTISSNTRNYSVQASLGIFF